MFTESMLRKNPSVVLSFTGIPSDEFWAMLDQIEVKFVDYEKERHTRVGRQRAVGGGRKFDQSLAQRLVAVLAYLRLHVPQWVIAHMFSVSQCGISRDLRRLLPLIRLVLPCPQVWDVVTDENAIDQASKILIPLSIDQLNDGRALVDATEQRVSRPSNNETRKEFYSGKKKAFTLKTQLVTDADHHIAAISTAVAGAMHDKKLSDQAHTVERLPDGCKVDADKAYQGMAEQVNLITVRNAETGLEQQVPRITVRTPFKKPKGKELTEDQRAFNQKLGAIRVNVEHCIGWAKNWTILANRFRCDHSIYTSVMQTVCGLVNAQTHRWQGRRIC